MFSSDHKMAVSVDSKCAAVIVIALLTVVPGTHGVPRTIKIGE